jgi:hypothetical protein
MTEKQALLKSIEKWSKIHTYEEVDKGIDNCPLCLKYNAINCNGCPVAEKTETISCNGTPYALWVSHQQEYHKIFVEPPYEIECSVCEKLAFEMWLFLYKAPYEIECSVCEKLAFEMWLFLWELYLELYVLG